MKRLIWCVGGASAAAALFLALMVGMFWLLEVLPLLGLLAAIGVYAAGSSSRPATGYGDGPSGRARLGRTEAAPRLPHTGAAAGVGKGG